MIVTLKQLFGIVNSILGRGRQIVYPQHMDSFTLVSLFNNYFITKIADIRNEFPVLESDYYFKLFNKYKTVQGKVKILRGKIISTCCSH